MIKIVKGNDVKLSFPFYERLEDGSLIPLEVSEIQDLQVKFVRNDGEETTITDGIVLDKNNIIVTVPCLMDIGKYHVAISGLFDNAHVCSMMKDYFQIVKFNDGNNSASILCRYEVNEHVVQDAN